MKFQVKVQNGNCKFVKFYIEADIVDGIVRFLSEEPVVACDITRQVLCGYNTRTKIHCNNYTNLNEDNTDNFQEMFVHAGVCEKVVLSHYRFHIIVCLLQIYKKIFLSFRIETLKM